MFPSTVPLRRALALALVLLLAVLVTPVFVAGAAGHEDRSDQHGQ